MNGKIKPLNVLLKALGLFLVVNILYGLIQPPIADISAYNSLFPGLKRMPFGTGREPFSVTVDNADVMFAAHEISTEKLTDEIRVALIGDSSIWGENLSVDETLAGQWNQAGLQCNGKAVKFYNLGYPHPSIIKDLIFIEETMERKPDAILWFVTLNTLMNQYRLHPFVIENRERALRIIESYDIPFAPRKTLAEQETNFYAQTLTGQRTFLARWLRLQTVGLVWSATGADLHTPPKPHVALANDVRKNPNYRDLVPGSDLEASLLLEAFTAGHDLAGDTPILLVNEPIFVAQGYNSEIRYNDLYPHWAYDLYRDILISQTQTSNWPYIDLWNAIPSEYFTDTPMHVDAAGERLLMEELSPTLLPMICN